MKRLFILTGLVCLSFMLLPACAPEEVQEAEPATEEGPSIEADIEAIKRVGEQEVAAVIAGDAEAFRAVFAADFEVMPPNQPAIRGEAARQWIADFVGQFDFEAKPYSNEEVEVDGDLAYHRYSFEFIGTPKAGGDPVHEKGSGLHILKRQSDGSWKFVKDIWTPEAPPAQN